MTYAFTFDASACTGCMDCTAACQTRNQLPTGVMWRRTYKVAVDGWIPANDKDFSYSLSLACNHCAHPKCAGVCPADAYLIRADGIVSIDRSKCMGCGYCSWACPYGAPQFNPVRGQMTKCDFCSDQLNAGLPPACVTACSQKALGFVELTGADVSPEFKRLWELHASEHPYPLPKTSRTQPHLALKPHAAMTADHEKRIINCEEVKSKRPGGEVFLIFFTLLTQMAVGGFWAAQWMFDPFWNLVEFDARLFRLIPYWVIGLCLCLGGLASLSHLGAKRNAWRALAHLRKSWLSREILYLGLFSAGWLVSISTLSMGALSFARIFTCILGAVLIYGMAQVYHLQSMPAWNHWRTTAGFFLTTALLGLVLMLVILSVESLLTEVFAAMLFPAGVAAVLLAGELGLSISAQKKNVRMVGRLRAGMIAAVLAGLGILFRSSGLVGVWLPSSIFLLVLLGEVIERRAFYEVLHHRVL